MLEGMDEAQSYVLTTARENDVRFIRLWFSDILGRLKGFAITIEELEAALIRGVGFDGSSILGLARVDENDMVAMPDPTTFRILPWRPKQNAVARMFCDILTPTGEPLTGDPRYILKRSIAKAAEMGYTHYVGTELEYFYLKGPKEPEPLDDGGYFDQLTLEPSSDMRRETVLTLHEMGVLVKYSHHEAACSQHEIDLQYADALAMADNIMTAKTVIKEVAYNNGIYATFMPKPLSGVNGSGMHVYQSLFNGDENCFFDDNEPYKLSRIGQLYVAGLLKHAPEITLVTNQWVNSYKRLVPGYEAPVFISWAHVNHSDLIRIPAYKPGREGSVRIEYRAPDPACNPYLAFAVMLTAGLNGIKNEYEVPSPIERNLLLMDDTEREQNQIGTLPGNLWEAIQVAEKSDLLKTTLGEHLFSSFIQNKKIEWENYRSQVSAYETEYYLPML